MDKKKLSFLQYTLKVLISMFATIAFLIIIGVIIFIAMQDSILYKEIIHPSYLSVADVCYPKIAEIEKNKTSYVVAGYYSPSDDKIVILIPDPDNSINKHEECHRQQSRENRFYGCSKPIFMYMNELECYIKQRR